MKCGNCKQEHSTTEEVKACYSGEQQTLAGVERTPPPAQVVSGPTQNQRNFITQLLEQTGKTEDEVSMDTFTMQEASDLISQLLDERKALGKRNPEPTRLPSNIKGEEVPQGIYTVVFSEEYGDYITLRFRAPKQGKWRGTQLVEFLYGPDNDHDYRRCGNWTGDGYRVWADFKRESRITRGITFMATANKEDTIIAGEAYALRSNNCWRCNRTLTREESITRGMGPICARIVLG